MVESLLFQVVLVSSAVYCFVWMLLLLGHFIFSLLDDELISPFWTFTITYVIMFIAFWLQMRG